MTDGSGVIRATDRPRLRRGQPLPDIQRLVDAGNGATSMAIWRNWLVPGDRIPAHRHTFEEVLVVIEGACEVRIGEQTSVVAAGDAVIVPAQTAHEVVHRGAVETVVVAALADPDPEPRTFPV